MKLISFDVGLRNLAVCVLEGTSRKDLKILHWDVIDVLGEKNGVARPVCFKCSKAAMWSQASSDVFACSKHCPKTAVVTKSALNKKTIGEVQELAASYGIDSTQKKPALVLAIFNHLKSGGWTKFKGRARGVHTVLDLDKDIVVSLNKRESWWLGADLAIFENQIGAQMKMVQSMLHMYFAVKGITTRGVSAVHKLDNILTIEDRTDTYRGRKNTGILHCETLAPACNLPFFKSHKKKDDLADAFLQAVWVLEHAL
jgi:hypothetical protein